MEALETRNLLSTFTVTNTSNSGAGSLAQAIVDANNHANAGGTPDAIAFNIPGSGVQRITLTQSLPAVTDPVVLNGYTQPGAIANTQPIDQPDNAVILIRIDGSQAVQGLTVGTGGGGSTIEGLDITGFDSTLEGGISLSTGAGGNRVIGNFIGTDPTGMTGSTSLRNYMGIDVQGPDNVIGGTDPADRNVISANQIYGIDFDGASAVGNVMQGNYVGLQADGNAAFPLANVQESVFVDHAANTTIGGTSAADRNVIAGLHAIELKSATNTVIQGNDIGTDRTGTIPVYSGKGIIVTSSTSTLIGGTAAGAGNVIASSATANQLAVQIDLSSSTTIQGNFMGVDRSQTHNLGTLELGVTVQRSTGNVIGGTAAGAGNVIANAVDSGGGASVYIPITGSTVNDVLIEGNSFYGDDGPAINGSNTAAPVLAGANSTTITGHLAGTAGSSYRIEYFATPNTGAGTNHQAKNLIGVQSGLIAEASGNLTLSFSPAGGVPAGQYITATATRDGVSTSDQSTAVLSSAGAPSSASLGVAVSATPGTVAAAGNITYTVTVSNPGPDPAAAVKLTTSVPGGTSLVSFTGPNGWTVSAPGAGGTGPVTASAASVPRGGTAVFTFVVRVNPGAAGGSVIPMGANVSTTTADPNPAGETAGATTRVASRAAIATSTQIATSTGSANAGQPVTLRATVTSPSRVPIGNVTFMDGSIALGVVALDANGHAALTTSKLGVGTNTVTAIYDGTATFATSQASTNEVIATQGAGPRITQLLRYGYHWMPTVLVLNVDSPLDPSLAQNAANYQITGPGGRAIGVSSVVYNPTNGTITINPSERLNLHWSYQLRVNGSSPSGVRGADGAMLNAVGVGQPGHDYVTNITRANLISSPIPLSAAGWPRGSRFRV